MLNSVKVFLLKKLNKNHVFLDGEVKILGQLPHFKSEQCLHLASLQEMLDQPLLKKSLWDAIQITSLQPKA